MSSIRENYNLCNHLLTEQRKTYYYNIISFLYIIKPIKNLFSICFLKRTIGQRKMRSKAIIKTSLYLKNPNEKELSVTHLSQKLKLIGSGPTMHIKV